MTFVVVAKRGVVTCCRHCFQRQREHQRAEGERMRKTESKSGQESCERQRKGCSRIRSRLLDLGIWIWTLGLSLFWIPPCWVYVGYPQAYTSTQARSMYELNIQHIIRVRFAFSMQPATNAIAYCISALIRHGSNTYMFGVNFKLRVTALLIFNGPFFIAQEISCSLPFSFLFLFPFFLPLSLIFRFLPFFFVFFLCSKFTSP